MPDRTERTPASQSERRTQRGVPHGAFRADGGGEGGKVLFVLTSHETLGQDDGKPTGFHLFEAARPWRVLRDAGFHIDFASPRGGAAPIDPGSLDNKDPDNAALLKDPVASRSLRNTIAIERVCATDYRCVYFPGGHGAMWDFPDNPHIQRIAADIHDRGGVVAAICHGPAALVNARNAQGLYLVEGLRIAAFTDEEERAIGKERAVPFLLASRLQERGALHVKAENFRECVVADRRVVTGQNPASAGRLAETLRETLQGRVALNG